MEAIPLSSQRFPHGYALLIGVGADLPITVRDASALYQILTDPDRAGYPNGHAQLLTNGAASREGILHAFDRLAASLASDPEATAFVYYSGHGATISSAGHDEGYFLLPYGYDYQSAATIQRTLISGQEFTEKLEALHARKLLVFLDCCHAAGIPKDKASEIELAPRPVPPDIQALLETGSGRVIVASCHRNESSYVGQHYSIFTECLLDALRGREAQPNDGVVRILGVLTYLFREVPLRAPLPQHPFVNKLLNLGDNFPICLYAGNELPVTSPAQALTDDQRRRMAQRAEALREEWVLRAERIHRVRRALAIETDPTVRFKLEHNLLDDEEGLTKLEEMLDQLLRQLG